MKVSFSRQGIITVTAETKRENEVLFHLVNGGSIKMVDPAEGTEKKTRSDKGGTHTKPKRRTNFKTCPVEGCTEKAKNIALHMRLRHGIWEGESHSHAPINALGGRRVEVQKPVTKTENGWKLRDMPKKGLLDDEPVFTRGGIIV